MTKTYKVYSHNKYKKNTYCIANCAVAGYGAEYQENIFFKVCQIKESERERERERDFKIQYKST